ncbi:MAG: hypothetical protein U0470_07180 [Anaerolineae bacterium]
MRRTAVGLSGRARGAGAWRGRSGTRWGQSIDDLDAAVACVELIEADVVCSGR